jgi:hypothetical protein
VIWWIWTVSWRGDRPEDLVHTFDVVYSWTLDEPDVAWLGEGAWTAMTDNSGIGLR